MKRKFFYLIIAILAFGTGTFFALYFYSPNVKPVLQDQLTYISPKPVLQTETQSTKTNNLINIDDLKIKGIGLDSTEKDLIKKFGKPQKVNNGGYNECAELYEKTLSYSGLELHLLGDKKREFKVYSSEITSPEWVTVSEIKIGDDIKDVIAKFGERHREGVSSVAETLYYGNDIGSASFAFSNNKLVRIWFEYILC